MAVDFGLKIPPGGMIPAAAESQLLALVSAFAIKRISDRAFPDDGSRGRGVSGSGFKLLSQGYRWYKSGSRPYKSPASKKVAWSMRQRSGKPGWGPLVDELGNKRRLAARTPMADMRMTNLTAKALGEVSRGPGFTIIGFRDTRSRRLFPHLQRRNRFWGLSAPEEQAIGHLADAAIPKLIAQAGAATLKSDKVTVAFTIGK